MIPQCFLHIGTEKTGSTSIQYFLSKNREKLEEQGILYARSPGNQNHTALTVSALRGSRQTHPRRAHAAMRSLGVFSPEQAEQAHENLIRSMDRELADSDASIIILSNEHLSSRLLKPRQIRLAKELCDRYAERTTIIVYLRNQVDSLVSSFGTTIKSGGTRKFPFPLSPSRTRTLDYYALLKPWRSVFGRKNIIVRRFETSRFIEGDLFCDFAAQIPFDPTGFRREARNPALGARELAFLLEFNARVPRWLDEKTPNLARGKIVAALESIGGAGPRLKASPEIASSITATFEESNRRVAEEYFGEDELFLPPQLVADVQMEALLELNCSDAMDVACKLWSAQQLQLQKYESQRKNRDTQLTEDVDESAPDIDGEDRW